MCDVRLTKLVVSIKKKTGVFFSPSRRRQRHCALLIIGLESEKKRINCHTMIVSYFRWRDFFSSQYNRRESFVD